MPPNNQVVVDGPTHVPGGDGVLEEKTCGSSIEREHLRQIRASALVHFDGTGLKTLCLGQDKAWDGYLEVLTCGELTVFQFDRKLCIGPSFQRSAACVGGGVR